MCYDVITFGIPMVEMTRKKVDQPLDKCGEFVGPFPAGDPGILLNACVRLGCRGAYVGVVGNDDFGTCFMECMNRNHVDTSHIRVDPVHTTGMSLMSNFSDGSRKFIFTMSTSAAAQLGEEDFDAELLKQVKWIHVSGFALSVSESIAKLHDKIIRTISDDVMVSFDPNYRKEIISVETYLKRCHSVFERCNLFLPSKGEASLFSETRTDDMQEDELETCQNIAISGKMVVLKDGAAGAYGFSEKERYFMPAFDVVEKDPTGAGDICGGAVVASLLRGNDMETSLRYGCAAGALAASRLGLMDIAPTWEELDRLILKNKQGSAE
jgi:sugar/nucleoside kinase (ribokinase family)